MAFCTQCGAKLEEGAKFCTSCGARLAQVSADGAQGRVEYPTPAGEHTQNPRPQSTASYDPTIYSTGSKPAKKSGGAKIPLIILAVLIVIGALIYVVTSRGGGKKDDPNLGLYQAVRAEMGGFDIAVSDMWEGGFSIELKSGGKCTVNVDGTKGDAKWSLDGREFTLTGNGLDCSGTLNNGVIVLENVMDTGIRLTFTRDGVDLADEPEPEVAVQPQTDPDAALLGSYEAVKAEAFGAEVDINEVLDDAFVIELAENGVCYVKAQGSSSKAGWQHSGDSITIIWDSQEMKGTLVDDGFTLDNMLGLGVKFTFQRTGDVPAPASAPAVSNAEEDYSWWNGDWYGWWVAYDAGGKYADDGYIDHAWDVCATFTVKGSSGRLKIWDEDGDDVAQARVAFNPGLSEHGSFINTTGHFYSQDLEEGEWDVDPALGMTASFEDMFCLHGTYYASNGEDWIEYYIFLRPWGTRWDDVADGDTSDMIYPGDMMPLNYDSWYLPLIEAGESMPADFAGLYD